MKIRPFTSDILRRLFVRFAGQGSFLLIYATALMVMLAGLWIARESGQAIDLRMRRDLVSQVAEIAATVNPSNLKALSFTADDISRPEFKRICDQFEVYAELVKIDTLYILALRDGQIVFGPESSADVSPGTVYQRPSLKDFELFETGSSQIQGPREDEYGTFVSATAPVFDPRTGEVLAAVGIDIEASVWQAAVRRAQWIPAILTLVLLLVLSLSWLTLKHRRKASPQRYERRRHAEIILCAIFLTLLTLLLAVVFHQKEYELRRNTFRQMALTQAATCRQEYFDLRSRIDQLVYYFESSQDVTRDEFSTYCKYLVNRGVLEACVWLPAVPESDAGSFLQTVRASGLPDFSIWQKNKEGRNEPVAGRPVYYPALYIEPLAGHESGFGYDLNSEPARSAAMQETLRTGLPTATDPVQFVTRTNSLAGLFVFSPVHAPVQKGLVALAIRPENLLGGAQRHNKKHDLEVCLFQLRHGKEPLFIAGSSSHCGLPCFDDYESDLGVTVPIFRFGKAYVLRLMPNPVWLAAHPLQHGLLAGFFGLLVTILVCSIVAQIVNRRITLEKKVERRTAELQASEKRFKDVTLNSSDWLWEVDAQGVYTYVSEKSFELLGYTPQEMIGKTPFDVMPPGQAKAAQDFFAAAVKDHKPFRDYENWAQHKDGTSVCLLSSGIPVFADDGTLTGYRGTDTDITERKRDEAVLDARMEELQRWQTATLGREGRIGELKGEVNALAVRLGQPPPYAMPEKSMREEI